MRQGGDDRAQSVQVGAIVLFGFLIVAASAYQAFVVPQENARVEFNDYQGSAADMVSLRNAMLSSAADGNVRGQRVSTGTQYPVRVFLVNPPPARGTVATVDGGTVSVNGIEAIGEYRNVGTYIESEGYALNYSTRSVAFRPAYNEFDAAAPVVVSNGLVYRNFPAPVVSTSQSLVRSNRIRLVTLSGDLRTEGLSAGVTVDPVSAHVRTVTVTPRAGSFNITVPTTLSEGQWETLLGDQLDPDRNDPDRYVLAVTRPSGADYVNVTMEGGASYELQVARLDLRERSDADDAASPDARYVVTETERTAQTNRDGRLPITVEARDRFNNPVSDANVTFSVSKDGPRFEREDGTALADANPDAAGNQTRIRTNGDGEATVYLNATGSLGSIPVSAYLGSSDPGTGERKVTYSVFNTVHGGSGGDGSGEQAGRSLVVLNRIDPVDGADRTITLNLSNTGTFPVNATGYRLDYVSGLRSNGQLVESARAMTNVTFVHNGTSSDVNGVAREGSSPHFFASNPYAIQPGSTDARIQFDRRLDTDSSGNTQNIQGIFISFAIYLEGDITVTFAFQIIV